MEDDFTPAPRRRSRLWIFVLVPLGLALIAWAALVVAFPPARLRAVVSQKLGATLSREVRFGDARIGLWPPVRISIADLALAEPGGFAHGAMLRARAVHLDLDVVQLLGRRLVVKRLALDRPTLHLLLRADGGTNLDQLGAPSGKAAGAAPIDLALERIEITGARVLIDDMAARRRTLFVVATRSGYSMARDGSIRTEGESHLRDLRFGPLGAASDAEMNGSLAKVDWKIEHQAVWSARAKRLALGRLALSFGGTAIALQGVVDAAGPRPLVDLRATGRGVDLGEILDHVAAADARLLSGIHGAGRLEFDLRARGAITGPKRPVVTGTLAIRNGQFSYPGVPVAIEAVSLDARFSPDSVVVPAFTSRVSGQPVRGAFEATRFADPLVRFALVGNLDLAATSRFLVEGDTKLDGKLELDVRGSGRAKDPGTFDLAGWARLENASVLSPKLPKRIERLNGRFDFSAERASIQGLRAQAGKSSFTLDASATRPLAMLAKPSPNGPKVAPAVIDFTLRSPYLDLAELLAPTPGGPLLPNARGGGRVTIGHLKYGRLDADQVSAKVQLTPTGIVASPFGFTGYGGAVSGTAHIDVTHPERPRVTLEARVDSTRADALLAAWTGAGKIVHGRLGSKITLAVDGLKPEEVKRTLTAEGVAEVVNGTLGPAPLFETLAAFTKVPAWREVRFQDFHAPFRVENGKVATGPAKLVGSHGEWLISGTIGFDGALDYALSITLPQEMAARLGAGGALAAAALADENGRVLLDLRVTGNAKSPRVSWDTRATRDRLLGKKSSALLAPLLGGVTPADTLASLGRAAQDSARAEGRRLQRAMEDSLRNAAKKALNKLFGGGKRDTATRP